MTVQDQGRDGFMSASYETEKRERIRPPRRPRRRGVPLLAVLILVVVVGICGFFARDYLEERFPQSPAWPSITKLLGNTPDEVIPVDEDAVVSVWKVEEILKPASELITVKYHYTDADVFENYKQIRGWKIPGTTNKTIFTYDGVISVGVDFSQIGVQVDPDTQTITISLPEPSVIANEINASSFQYYDVSNSVFNQTEMDDVTELVKVLKEKKAEKILANQEVLQQAKDNAQTVLQSFLSASDLTKDYSVVFEDQA